MAEDFVELGSEALGHFTDRYFDRGYDRYRKWVNGRKVESVLIPYERKRGTSPTATRASRGDVRSGSSSASPNSAVRSSAGGARPAGPAARRSELTRPARPRSLGAAAAGAVAGVAAADNYSPSHLSRRARSIDEQQSLTSERILRDYESERDDPPRRADPALLTQLSKRNLATRRDSAMGSNYGGERPRSARGSRYEDDYESDYDEHTGRRERGGGRGYDDRDYDRIIEETERYRGPPLARRGSGRSAGTYDDDRAYAVAHRRSGDYERSERDGYSRRSSGHRHRDRSYDSRDRSRSRSRENWKEKLEDTFDTSAKGIGVGIAGAVIGGLAGRELSHKGKNSTRDAAIGAIIGGLGANIAAEKWREYKDRKEGQLERAEERWEQKWDGGGRSRSRGR